MTSPRLVFGAAMAVAVLCAQASPSNRRRHAHHHSHQHSLHRGPHHRLHHGRIVHPDKLLRSCAESSETTLAFYKIHTTSDGPMYSYIEEEIGDVGSWHVAPGPGPGHPSYLCPVVTRERVVRVPGTAKRLYFTESRCEQPEEAVRTDPTTGLAFMCVTLVGNLRNVTDDVGLCGPVGCAAEAMQRQHPPTAPVHTQRSEDMLSTTEQMDMCWNASEPESHAFFKDVDKDYSIHYIRMEMGVAGSWDVEQNPREELDGSYTVCPTELRKRVVEVPGTTQRLHYTERRCKYRGALGGVASFRCVDLLARQDIYAGVEVCGPVGCSVERIID